MVITGPAIIKSVTGEDLGLEELGGTDLVAVTDLVEALSPGVAPVTIENHADVAGQPLPVEETKDAAFVDAVQRLLDDRFDRVEIHHLLRRPAGGVT